MSLISTQSPVYLPLTPPNPEASSSSADPLPRSSFEFEGREQLSSLSSRMRTGMTNFSSSMVKPFRDNPSISGCVVIALLTASAAAGLTTLAINKKQEINTFDNTFGNTPLTHNQQSHRSGLKNDYGWAIAGASSLAVLSAVFAVTGGMLHFFREKKTDEVGRES